jgi:hypothetical protein
MSYNFAEIDHLLGSYPDPQQGGDLYERLGFTVTPLSVIENLGVGNRLVLMQPMAPRTANFFECMGVVDPQRAAAPMAKLLSGPAGIRSMVLSGPDARGSQALLARDGYPCAPPLDLRREWRLPSGETLHPAFLVTLPAPVRLPFNFCEYRTLDCYLRPQWLEHVNGALHLTGVLALDNEPETGARYFEKVFSGTAVRHGDLFSVGPGRVQLRIGSQLGLRALVPLEWLAGSEPRYVGFEIEVRSLAALRALLAGRGVEFIERAGAIVVAPDEACGNILRFHETHAA